MSIQPGFYMHYKGGIYQVLHTAAHTETGESVVVYTDANDAVWVRPVAIFSEEVTVNGARTPRFQRLTSLTGTASAV